MPIHSGGGVHRIPLQLKAIPCPLCVESHWFSGKCSTERSLTCLFRESPPASRVYGTCAYARS